ncbi:AcrR family transcriptional regulator [Leifsonia sp. AK011]|uniref:TetR/AcrR family transcriptional regulator n=1 Tax=Leifsonia sp. AK011 TaxID=2723075 RepID=UPI0015C88087|nr:TetR family transcriptional regulator [Leifsonia sp. AK011]NYF09829.1 AcrR family transcriptional regulator [Leifsonia sp. AK011]
MAGAGETREALIAAARRLIPRLGWEGVSARALAAEAGVRSGVVHYHFESVSAVLRAAAASASEQVFGPPVEAMLASPTRAEGLTSLLAGLAALDRQGESVRLLFESALASTRDAALREQTADSVAALRVRIAEWLLPESGDQADLHAAIITAMLDGLLFQQGVDAEAADADPAAMARTLEIGMSGDSSTAPRSFPQGRNY